MIFLLVAALIVMPLIVFGLSRSPDLKPLQQADLGRLHPNITAEGFNPLVHHGGAQGYGIAIDPVSERFAILIPGHPPRVYHYSQLIAAEAIRDGVTITTTKGKVDYTGPAIATALIGPLGALVGGRTASTSKTQNNVTGLALRVFTNDLLSPCFEILFFQSPTGVACNDSRVQSAIREADAWLARLQTILVGLERQGSDGPTGAAVDHTDAAAFPVIQKVPWANRVFDA